MNEISKAILKAKKLLRMAESSNENESNLAKKQLKKLKEKFKLFDDMIFPIYVKSVFRINKGEKLNLLDEFLYFNIGKLFANKVFADSKKDYYEISFKGNDLTIEKAIKSISFINTHLDRYLERLSIEDKYSYKCGLGMSICKRLSEKISFDELIEDEKTESDKSIFNKTEFQKPENIEKFEKQDVNKEILILGESSTPESLIIIIERYINSLHEKNL